MSIEIWNKKGDLLPISNFLVENDKREIKDVAVIIVNRDRPDLTNNLVEQVKGMSGNLKVDTYVVEMGSTKKSKYASIYYDDPEYLGKSYGHNVGLRYAMSKGRYRYYWILMNDLVFNDKSSLKKLVNIADKHTSVGILSPTEPEGAYADCRPHKGSEFHYVSTTDYLGFLIRHRCVSKAGFLNPNFKYCWGAIHELAHKCNKAGWSVAYCDKVTMKHLGGTTYGKVKNTISREEYKRRAKRFAARYFVEHYGKNWDDVFTKHLPKNVRKNTFKLHRPAWESALSKEEREYYSRRDAAGNSLQDKIVALQPWFYPVKIKNIVVKPGIINGSRDTIDDKHLVERTEYRKNILVDELVKRYNFKNKSLLDIASNCAYWSSHYVKYGANSLTAIEGRLEYVKQGRLYWGENNILPKNRYNFIHSNILDEELWKSLSNKRFDFSLCCGILYHIEDYEGLLRKIDSITNEAILVDTRVSDGKDIIEEPGGWFFDAIVETRFKRVPNVKNITEVLKSMGYQVEILKTDAKLPKLMAGSENYVSGRRVCLLAKKVK